MTIEEKAQRIKDHCLSIESRCDGCELQGALQKTCYERCDIYPEEIERNYRILFGEEKKDKDICKRTPKHAGYAADNSDDKYNV